MEDKPHVAARRLILQKEIACHGLAVIARKAGKADRQLNDMTTSRKAFGDRIARDLEPLLRPDLPAGWLVFASPETAAAHCASHPYPPATGPTSAHAINEQIITADQETEIKTRTQQIADQSAEMIAIWVRLSPARRLELLQSLRTEAGKISNPGQVKTVTASKAGRHPGRKQSR